MALTPPVMKIPRTNAKESFRYPVPYGASNMSAGTAANAAATVTIAADNALVQDGTPETRPLNVGMIWWSYSGAPTGGRITLSDANGTYIDLDITAAGPGNLPLTDAILCGTTAAMSLSLAAAGAAVTGKCGIVCWRQE